MSRTRRSILPWAAHHATKTGLRNEFERGYDKLSRRRKTSLKADYNDRLDRLSIEKKRTACVLRDQRQQLVEFHTEQVEARQERIGQKADKFHESIIKDPADYDGLEVCGVIAEDFPDGTTACEAVFSATEPPDFYSVYACLKDGGVECIGDLPTRGEALAYAKEIHEMYGWPVTDFTWVLPLRELPAAA